MKNTAPTQTFKNETNETGDSDFTRNGWSDLEELGKQGFTDITQEQERKSQGYTETNKLLRPNNLEASQNITETKRDLSWGLGKKVLSIAGVIKETISEKTKQITGKEMVGRSYFIDRYDRNMQYMKDHTEDKSTFDPSEVYKDLMQDFPELRNVKITSYIRSNSFAAYHVKENDEDAPMVAFNFNPNTFIAQYLEESENFKSLPYDQREEILKDYFYDHDLGILEAKPKSEVDSNILGMIKALSEKMGKKPEELLQNKKLMSTFIFVHEFGHQLDFRRNYLNPHLERQIREKGRVYNRWQAIREAKRESDYERQNDGFEKTIKGGQKLFGHNAQEDFTRKEELYRNRHSESVADTVAIDFIIKYEDKYKFFDKSSEPIPENYNQKYQELQERKLNAELSEAEWAKYRQNLERDTWSASVLASLYSSENNLLDNVSAYTGMQNNLTTLKNEASTFLKRSLNYTRQCVSNKQKFGEHFSTNGTSGYDTKPDLKSTIEALAGYNNWLEENQAQNKNYQGDKKQDLDLKKDSAISKIVLDDFSIVRDLIDGRPHSKEDVKRRYQQLSADYRNRKMDNQADRLDKIFQAYLSIGAINPL